MVSYRKLLCVCVKFIENIDLLAISASARTRSPHLPPRPVGDVRAFVGVLQRYLSMHELILNALWQAGDWIANRLKKFDRPKSDRRPRRRNCRVSLEMHADLIHSVRSWVNCLMTVEVRMSIDALVGVKGLLIVGDPGNRRMLTPSIGALAPPPSRERGGGYASMRARSNALSSSQQ